MSDVDTHKSPPIASSLVLQEVRDRSTEGIRVGASNLSSLEVRQWAGRKIKSSHWFNLFLFTIKSLIIWGGMIPQLEQIRWLVRFGSLVWSDPNFLDESVPSQGFHHAWHSCCQAGIETWRQRVDKVLMESGEPRPFFCWRVPSLKLTAKAPTNGWLEYYFPIGEAMLVSEKGYSCIFRWHVFQDGYIPRSQLIVVILYLARLTFFWVKSSPKKVTWLLGQHFWLVLHRAAALDKDDIYLVIRRRQRYVILQGPKDPNGIHVESALLHFVCPSKEATIRTYKASPAIRILAARWK